MKRLACLPLLAVAACEGRKPPAACDPIPQVTVNAGETTTATACFTDPNGDPLDYSATSSNPGVAAASISGTTVTVTGVMPGSASVTVTASDPGGLTAEQSFEVAVPNRAPEAKGAIPPLSVPATDTVDASAYFTDPDGETLAYAATSSSPGVATVSVSGSTVTVAAVARGSTDVTVTATDPGGLAATQTFRATVPNRAPEAGDPIPDMEVFAGHTVEVDVSGHFRDPDGDTLAYAAGSASPGVATASVSGSTVAVAAVAKGSADVTVTAADPGGLAATQTFRVTVPNRAPEVGDPIGDMRAVVGDTVEVDVSGHFTDPDGDTLTYAATSAHPWVATVSVSGSTVSVAAVGLDTATLTVTATDTEGLSAQTAFGVRVRSQDRAVLETLYKGAAGPDWHNGDGWLTDAPIHSWHGVSVDEAGRVDSLVLETNNLVGSIPPGLADLTNLAVLDLGFNALTGSIPQEIGGLAQLEVLDLQGNALTGSVPPELGSLTDLTVLDLGFNGLAGSIPPEIGDLAQLEVLDLRGNALVGSIPPELTNLTNLTVLDLGFNALAGSIPPDIGKLSQLEVLDFRGDSLKGSIPPELAGLTKLTVLDLGFNDLTLTGPIPAWLAEFDDLTVLDIGSQGSGSGDRGYTGPVPTWLADLANLTELDLGSHRLSGSIPAELGSLAKLEELNLSLNDLTGSIPPALAQLSELKDLALAANDLSGSIPPRLGQLSKLKFLSLWSNDLSGPLSEDLGELSALVFLLIDNNELTDEFPDVFASLSMVDWARWEENAGLCAPGTEAFDTWLGAMKDGWSGPRCPQAHASREGASRVSALIRHLEERVLVAEISAAGARDREEALEAMKTVETLLGEIDLLRGGHRGNPYR